MTTLRQWLLGATALLALSIASGAYLGMRAANATIRAPCGLGPPPGHPDYAAYVASQEQEVRVNGYRRVCADNLKRYDIPLTALNRVLATLDFAPVDLARTPFAQYQSLGAMAEGINDIRSRLYRGFHLPDGRTLILFEHDMSADGSRMHRDPQWENERVKGMPARLMVLQAETGKAVSHVSWRDGRRSYELWIDANVAGTPMRAQLLALAASLPHPVPACPNEPAPAPWTLGPDGLPGDDLPASLPDGPLPGTRAVPCR